MRLFFVIILLCVSSCTQLTPEEKMIKETMGKTARIGMFESIRQGDGKIPFVEFRNRYPFISLVYLEDGCLPCYPRFIEWQTRMDTLDLNDDFTVLFIILGSSYERFMDNLYASVPEYEPASDRFHIVIGPDYRFMDNNQDIDRWVIDKSLLIDVGDKIKLIGPPFASQRMEELF
ncbi:MAG: hypothetical protein ACOCWM_02160 [Cyclobacteriaceae bacterium]